MLWYIIAPLAAGGAPGTLLGPRKLHPSTKKKKHEEMMDEKEKQEGEETERFSPSIMCEEPFHAQIEKEVNQMFICHMCMSAFITCVCV